MEYNEYLYNSEYNVLLFKDFLDTEEKIRLFEKYLYTMLIKLIINKNTKIFICGNSELSTHTNFLFVENNLYEFVFKSGNCQHYIQKNFMKNYIGAVYGTDNKRYLLNKKENRLVNFNNKKKFKRIGSEDNYFSSSNSAYLDNYISAIEHISNDLICNINNKIKANDYIYSKEEIYEIFINITLPLYIKSSTIINGFHFNIDIAYNKVKNNIKYNIAKELEILIAKKSNFYYIALQDYIIKNMQDIRDKCPYNYIEFIKISKKLPLSENILFNIDQNNKNTFNLGYNEEHSLFLFNENTIILFSKTEYSKKDIKEIKEHIIENMETVIISEAHDFLITEHEIPYDKLKSKTNYPFVNFDPYISEFLEIITQKKKKIMSKSIVPLLVFLEDNKQNNILYLHREYSSLASHKIILDDKTFYIDKLNLELILKNKNIVHCSKIFKTNPSMKFEHIGIFSKTPKINNNFLCYNLITKIVEQKYNKKIEVTFYKKDKLGKCVYIRLENFVFSIFLSKDKLETFNKYFQKYNCDYTEYKRIKESNEYDIESSIESIVFILYENNSSTCTLIKKE